MCSREILDKRLRNRWTVFLTRLSARKSFEPDPVSTGVGIGAFLDTCDRCAFFGSFGMYQNTSIEILAGQRLFSPEELRSTTVPVVGQDLPVRADVIIVGGGIIGLSIAWRLALLGQKVVVVEKARIGSGASLAATGMLAAAAEYEAGGEILIAFALESQRRWETFATELEQGSGMDLDFDKSGTLLVSLTRDETARLRSRFEMQAKAGLSVQWLSGEAVRELEGGLRPSVNAGIFCPLDFQIDPRLLIPALEKAARGAGVAIIEEASVDSLVMQAGAVDGIISGKRECRAPLVIVTTGADAGRRSFLPQSLKIPIRPLRGQSICLRIPERHPPLLQHVIWTEQVHMAQKSGGRLIVGATVEEAGFNPDVTVGGLFALLEASRRALPALEDIALEAVWSGFRPTSQDDAPILGASGVPGLLLAVGHHRNGILLAPSTADALVAYALGQDIPHSAEPLNLQRFGSAS